MTVESGSWTESWCGCNWPLRWNLAAAQSGNAAIIFLLRGTLTRSVCTSLDNQVSFKLNWNVKYLHVMYKYALCPYSAFFPPPPLFVFSKCCSCCKTMHRVHFQRLSTERLKQVRCLLKQVFVRCGCTGTFPCTGVNILRLFFFSHYSDIHSALVYLPLTDRNSN